MLKAIVGAALLATATTGLAATAPDYDLIPGTFEKGRQPDGNSIVLDAPDGLIVIDTGRHPAQQEKIFAAAKARGKPIVAIINSHWHLDHTGGNQEIRRAFPNAKIIASNAVSGALSSFLANSRKDAESYLASGNAPKEQEAEIRGDFAAMDHRADLIPTDPVTRNETREVAGRRLDIHLAPFAATEGDLWVYDPKTRTVFAGDLVVAFAPFMDTACVEGWLTALDAIEQVPFQTLVPGHGDPMSRADFAQWKTAFRNLVDCSAGTAAKEECIAGWNRDAARFVAPLAPRKVDPLIDYYIDTRLRSSPEEQQKYCRPVKPA